MKDYDVSSVFEEMELELIRSMKRNLARHQKWENDEGINWTMWQAEQLKTLENFKRENKKIFNKKFSIVNMEIEEFLKNTYETSGLDQEKEILNAIKGNKKFKDIYEKGLEGSFFKLNKKKMNALINATTNDFKKAEHAMLRMTNDQYRKIIFKAQVMSNSGAFTLQQSIDAATKDFLKAGINCIQYKNGRRVNIASYAEMCLRTSTKRAMLVSEGDVRNAYGVHTVRISKYGGCSETCLPWQGRVYVDDEFSGGTKEEAKQKKLPLLSEAIEGGLFHPNCKHRSTTYFYDLKKEQGKLQDDGIENPPEEQEHRKNQLHIQQQKRLEEGSLDPQNIQEAKVRKEQWIKRDEKLMNSIDYDELLIQNYKEVVLNENIIKDVNRLKTNVHALQSNTSNNIFISDKMKIKRKALHEINKAVTDALEMIDCDDIRPTFILISEKEMARNAIASYNAIENIVFINEKLADDNARKQLIKSFVSGSDISSTLIHELLHWKSASVYQKKYGKINNANYLQYIDYLNDEAKKKLDKLIEKGYNIYELGEYASVSFELKKFDETYTEYLTKLIVERRSKK